MSNMYTCIAYLIEITKFFSKNLVHKGVKFWGPQCSKTRLRAPLISKKFPGIIPPGPLKGEGGKGGEAPQFTFLATPLGITKIIHAQLSKYKHNSNTNAKYHEDNSQVYAEPVSHPIGH